MTLERKSVIGGSAGASRRMIGRIRLLARLRPFDTTTSEGRASERHRRILLAAVSSAAARCVSVLTQLITVRVTLEYLGLERYGLWMTISSIIAMASFADFGIGLGLVNAVSRSSGRDDWNAARKYISSGFVMLTGLALLLGGVFAALYPLIPWPRVFNVHEASAVHEAGPAIAAFVVCFLLNMPLGVVQRAQMGCQLGFVSNLWQCAGSILALAAMLAVVQARGGLWALIAAVSGVPLAILLVNGISFFGWSRIDLRPRLSFFSYSMGRDLLRMGILFFALQVAMSLAFFSDNIVIAQVIGPAGVAEYNVPARLFAIPGIFLGMILIPLWPAYGEAIARGDAEWARRTLRRSFKISLIFASGSSLALLLFGRLIVRLWVGGSIVPSGSLLGALAFWTVLSAVGNCLAMFLNGAHVIRFQMIAGLVMAATNLAMSILLARLLGVSGVVWGSVVSYALAVALPCAFIIPRVLASLRSHGPKTRVGLPSPTEAPDMIATKSAVSMANDSGVTNA